MYFGAFCPSSTSGRSRRPRVRPGNDEHEAPPAIAGALWSPQPPPVPVPDILIVDESLARSAPLRVQPLILGVFLGVSDVNAPAVAGINVGVLHHAIHETAHDPVGVRRLVELRLRAIESLLLEASRHQQFLRVVRLPPADRGATRQTQDGRDARQVPLHAPFGQGASRRLSGLNPGSGLCTNVLPSCGAPSGTDCSTSVAVGPEAPGTADVVPPAAPDVLRVAQAPSANGTTAEITNVSFLNIMVCAPLRRGCVHPFRRCSTIAPFRERPRRRTGTFESHPPSHG